MRLIPKPRTMCQAMCQDSPSLTGRKTEAEITSLSSHRQCDLGLDYEPKLCNWLSPHSNLCTTVRGDKACASLLEAPSKMNPRKQQEQSKKHEE